MHQNPRFLRLSGFHLSWQCTTLMPQFPDEFCKMVQFELRPFVEAIDRIDDFEARTCGSQLWPLSAEHWSLTTLRGTLVKVGAKVAGHGRHVTFQLAGS